MATMIICVKHFVNIPDIFFLILTLKIIINKIIFIFHKNVGGNMLPWQP